MFAFDVLFWPICVYKPVLLFAPLAHTSSLLATSLQYTAHAIAVCRRPVPIYNIKCIFDTRTSHGTNTFQYNFNLIFDYLFIFFSAEITAHTRTHGCFNIVLKFCVYICIIYIAWYSVRRTHTVTVIGLFVHIYSVPRRI